MPVNNFEITTHPVLVHLEEGVDEPAACSGNTSQALGLLGEQGQHLVGVGQTALELPHLQEALTPAQQAGNLLVFLRPRSRSQAAGAGSSSRSYLGTRSTRSGGDQLVVESDGPGPTSSPDHVVGLHLLFGGHRSLARMMAELGRLLRMVTHACVALRASLS